MYIYRFVMLCVILVLSTQLSAATVRVNFEVPYTTKFKRVQGNSGVKTVVEIPYKPAGGFCLSQCDQPSQDDLKAATDKVTASANLTLWRAFLAKMPSSNISQKEMEARKRVNDLVFDVSVEHQVVTADKMIVFTLRGKVNNNLVDQIAGFEPSEEDLAKARHIAKQKVLDQYIAKLDGSKIALLEKQKSNIYGRTDDIVSEFAIRDYKVIGDRKVVKYAVKGTVNDNLFNEILYSYNGARTGGKRKGRFAFLILPRIQSEVTSYDKTISKRAEEAGGKSNSKQSSESMEDSDEGLVEYESSAQKQRRVASTTSSGSSTQKSDKITWKLGDVKIVNAQLNRYLGDVGFTTTAFNRVVSRCGDQDLTVKGVRESVRDSETGEYGREYTRMIEDALIQCKIRYFGTGVMDVDSFRKDRGTGAVVADVSVTVVVEEYVDGWPEQIATMSKRLSGLGDSQASATENATEKASKAVADIVIAKLKTQGAR